MPLILQWDENFDVGADTGTPVDDEDYQVPFRFTGKLDKLTLTIDRPKLTPEDERKLRGAAQQQGERIGRKLSYQPSRAWGLCAARLSSASPWRGAGSRRGEIGQRRPIGRGSPQRHVESSTKGTRHERNKQSADPLGRRSRRSFHGRLHGGHHAGDLADEGLCHFAGRSGVWRAADAAQRGGPRAARRAAAIAICLYHR